MTTIKEQLFAAIEATPEPMLEFILDYLEYLKAKKSSSTNLAEALMQAGEPILRGSKAKDLLQFAPNLAWRRL